MHEKIVRGTKRCFLTKLDRETGRHLKCNEVFHFSKMCIRYRLKKVKTNSSITLGDIHKTLTINSMTGRICSCSDRGYPSANHTDALSCCTLLCTSTSRPIPVKHDYNPAHQLLRTRTVIFFWIGWFSEVFLDCQLLGRAVESLTHCSS